MPLDIKTAPAHLGRAGSRHCGLTLPFLGVLPLSQALWHPPICQDSQPTLSPHHTFCP